MEGSALRGRKNPMKPAVSWHTTLPAKSSVLYLWRPWVAERGCSGQEQALSVSHRTGGFCVLPDEKPRSMLKAESACSGVGDVAGRGEFRQKFLERSCITGGAKGISNPPQRRIPVTLEMQSSSVSGDHSDRNLEFPRWLYLHICENELCPTLQCKKSSSLSLAKNAFMQFLQSFRLEVSSASMKLNII